MLVLASVYSAMYTYYYTYVIVYTNIFDFFLKIYKEYNIYISI